MKFGRVSAPRYWMDGNFMKKVTAVFARKGVYVGQADCHWERDEGGLWAVLRVAIKEDDAAQVINHYRPTRRGLVRQ